MERPDDMIEVRMPRRDWEALIALAENDDAPWESPSSLDAALEALKVVKALVRGVPSAEL